MEIKFEGTHYKLTTEHPLSSYGFGILEGPDGVYMPSDVLPMTQIGRELGLQPMLAGELVIAWAGKRIMSNLEIGFLRRYLSQDAGGNFVLPEDLELRREQCAAQLELEMGDITQGVVAQCYWELGAAKVSVLLYESTGGRFVWEKGEVTDA